MEGKAIMEAYKKFAASKVEDNELFAPYRTKLAKCIISYDMAMKSPESVYIFSPKKMKICTNIIILLYSRVSNNRWLH